MDRLDILNKFTGKKVLVIGDLVIDKYKWGITKRVSKAAPIPVIKQIKQTNALAGTGNVAATITELNGEAFLVGIVGRDDEADTLKELLQAHSLLTDFIVHDKSRRTTQRSHVMVGAHHISRLDNETETEPSKEIMDKIRSNIVKLIKKTDIVVVSDRGKGFITREFMYYLTKECEANGKKLVVDPFIKHKDYYLNSFLITPTQREARLMLGLKKSEVHDCGTDLAKPLAEFFKTNVIIERYDKGLVLCTNEGEIKKLSGKIGTIVDITGARATFLGVLAIALATGTDIITAAEIAHLGSEITCQKTGTVELTIGELQGELKKKEFLSS